MNWQFQKQENAKLQGVLDAGHLVSNLVLTEVSWSLSYM